jgi:integrase
VAPVEPVTAAELARRLAAGGRRAAVTVNATLVQVGGRLVWGKPKSKACERVVGIDRDTAEGVKAHRTLRKRERQAAGEAWEGSGQMFTDELGRPLHPEYVSRRFRELATAAGLPVIKFHAARHTAATLALEAGVDVKIVTEQLGHSTTRITQDLYQHVRLQVHQDSAEKVRQLLPERVKRATATGL